jgi:hypothetical protein
MATITRTDRNALWQQILSVANGGIDVLVMWVCGLAIMRTLHTTIKARIMDKPKYTTFFPAKVRGFCDRLCYKSLCEIS